MKKTLMLFSLLVLTVSSQAQFKSYKHIDNTYLMKADLYKQRERIDTIMEFPQWGISRKDSTLITFKTDSVIVIENKEKNSYKLNRILEWSNGIDRDNDAWDGFIAVGTDNNGIMIKLTIMKYISETILITITYGNLEFRYQCRPYKKIEPIIV